MDYRHLIEIQEQKPQYDEGGFPVLDENGEEVIEFSTFMKLYASVNDLFGQEKYLAKQFINEKITSFKTRFVLGITPDMFIVFQNQRYEIIEYPDNVKYQNKELIIKARLVIV